MQVVRAEIVAREKAELGLHDLAKATIRELAQLAQRVERASGVSLVHMEMGVPGLVPSRIGVEAEQKALAEGCAQAYPPVGGYPELKEAVRQFVKNFIGVEVDAQACFPTAGSMQGAFAAFMVLNRCQKDRQRVLFIDPGFPVQKSQVKMLGFDYDTFDFYDYRGASLAQPIRAVLEKGHTSCMVYSNPNNPSWSCFTEEELAIIGGLSREFDVPVLEDLAYLGMDFREDMSHPGQPPYQPTVARYCDSWCLLLSGSKIFSYAGQRIGALAVGPALFERRYDNLGNYFPNVQLGKALLYGALYGLSSGVASSVQHGFTALLQAANAGTYNFVADLRAYGDRAKRLKEIFLGNGFQLVYSHDGARPLADGFYFTLCYPGLAGGALLEELLCYGVSAIALESMGSQQGSGLRACVSHVHPAQYDELARRMAAFHADHPTTASNRQ